MRILFLESHPMWIHGLPNGFRDLGHQVKIAGSLTDENLPLLLEEFCPELIMTIGWTPENDTPEKQGCIGRHVQGAGVPHVYWATEDPGYTHSFSLPYIWRVQPDFVFTICAERVDYYRNHGIAAAHLDFGYHVSVHRPVPWEEQYSTGIALVANGYLQLYQRSPGLFRFTSQRILVQPLLIQGYRIDFYGRYWDQMTGIFGKEIPPEWIHGYLPYTETSKVYSSASIIIGIQNMPTQLTQRTYEILASGGFLLTSDTPEIRRLFQPGLDLVVSASQEQTLELVRYYLENPEERQLIQKQGRLAVAQHSYKHRARYIINVLRKEKILPGYVE